MGYRDTAVGAVVFLGRVLFFERNPAGVIKALGRALWHSLRPDSLFRAQALAYMMFLVFFPALLFLVGAAAWLIPGWEELLDGIRQVLPPGSRRAVVDSLRLASLQPSQFIVTGGLGMLLLGTQFMDTLTRVFGSIYGRKVTERFWLRRLRTLGMVLVTVIPWLAVGVLQVSGRWVRGWLAQELGVDFYAALQIIWTMGYFSLIFLTAMLVVAALYHFLTPGREESWHNVLPGAFLAMVLGYGVSSGFGFYVLNIAFYNAVYGGFAATIGLLVWMFLSALVILIGAQFNANLEDLPRL